MTKPLVIAFAAAATLGVLPGLAAAEVVGEPRLGPVTPGTDEAAAAYEALGTDQGSVALLRSDGTVSSRDLPAPRGEIPTVAFGRGGFTAIWDTVDHSNGVLGADFSAAGAFGPVRQLAGGPGTPSGTEYDSVRVAITRQGERVYSWTEERDGVQRIVVSRYSQSGVPIERNEFRIAGRVSAARRYELVPRGDGEVWLAVIELRDARRVVVTVRRLSAQRVTLASRRIFATTRRADDLELSASADGRGGLFAVVGGEVRLRGERTRSAFRVAHVSSGGRVRKRRFGRIETSPDQFFARFRLVVTGGRATLVYSVSGRTRRGRPLRGVFLRRFRTSGRLSRRRKLARRGTLENAARTRVGQIWILRSHRGLRLHRIPRRGRPGGGRVVTRGNACCTALGFDPRGRAYVDWLQADGSCVTNEFEGPSGNAFARVMLPQPLPARLLARCEEDEL